MWVRHLTLVAVVLLGSVARAQDDPVPPPVVQDPADGPTETNPTDSTEPEDPTNPDPTDTATDPENDPDADTENDPETETATRDAEPGTGVRVLETLDEEDQTAPHGFVSGNRRHARMVGVRVGAGFGYLFAIKYTSGSPCESADPTMEPESFCNRLTEPFLDLELSYSVTDKLEIGAYVMLALTENDAALAKPRVFGLGIRGYTTEESVLKGYFGARVLLDITNSAVSTFDDFDIGIRGEFGIQIEPIRWLGIWLGGAVGVQFLRNFTFIPQLNGGLQVRFP